jgi:hypothetical protein
MSRLCSFCKKEVHYGRHRRKCRVCYIWCHEDCSFEMTLPGSFPLHPVCFGCIRKDPNRYLRKLAFSLNGQKPSINEPSEINSIMFILWSLVFGRNSIEEAISKLSIPKEVIRKMDSRLEENKIWSDDGIMTFDESAFKNEKVFNVSLLLYSLVADGKVVRSSEDRRFKSSGSVKQETIVNPQVSQVSEPGGSDHDDCTDTDHQR